MKKSIPVIAFFLLVLLNSCFENNPEDVANEFTSYLKKGQFKKAERMLSSEEIQNIKEYYRICKEIEKVHPDLVSMLELKSPLEKYCKDWINKDFRNDKCSVNDNYAYVSLVDDSEKEFEKIILKREGNIWHINLSIYEEAASELKDYSEIWQTTKRFADCLKEGNLDKAFEYFLPSDRILIKKLENLLKKYPDPPEESEALQAWESIQIEKHFKELYKDSEIVIEKPIIQDDFAYVSLKVTKNKITRSSSFKMMKIEDKWIYAFAYPQGLDELVETILKRKISASDEEGEP
ncbi:MAG: hypothetical protein JXA60_05025 [Candidatus Coatesbacteria bacterium]|nr:hypothetical protein [Candidatus Coatesbacteria bacterium]